MVYKEKGDCAGGARASVNPLTSHLREKLDDSEQRISSYSSAL
jgi:hypothetical protein